jgi:hypothetical protein
MVNKLVITDTHVVSLDASVLGVPSEADLVGSLANSWRAKSIVTQHFLLDWAP